jgi:predicted dehydrogenase
MPVGVRGQDPSPVVAALERAGKTLVVNYMRRWEPEHVKIGDALRAGGYGRVGKAIAFYSKGLLHNGSHFLDVFMSWFGHPTSWRVLGSVTGENSEDPALDVRLQFPGGATGYLLAGDVEHYSQDEIDLWTEKGRVQVTDYSRTVRFTTAEFNERAGKRKLTGRAESVATCYDGLMLRILDGIVSSVVRGRALPSTGRTALETLTLCNAILDEWRRLGVGREQ